LTGLVATFVGAETYACADRPFLTVQGPDGVKLGLSISEERLAGLPDWKPGESEPPLSISEAVEISTKWGTEYFSKYEAVFVSEIKLSQIRCSAEPSKWYYLIDVTPEFDGHAVHGAARNVAVLLDGTILPMREIP